MKKDEFRQNRRMRKGQGPMGGENLSVRLQGDERKGKWPKRTRGKHYTHHETVANHKASFEVSVGGRGEGATRVG